MGIREHYKKRIRELEELYKEFPSLIPSKGKVIGTSILTLIFGGIIIGFSSEIYKTRKLLHRGELVYEERYIIKKMSPSDYFEHCNFSATPVGKNNIVFFEPYGRLESIIEPDDTLTLMFLDRQWKYLNNGGKVPIKDRNLKYINGKKF